MKNDGPTTKADSAGEPVSGLSRRALSTPEPFVRLFARRVQQEGALDLTQGDYKNADFAPHPEVVRAAQRITRNTVHSYGPAVGRMDVRSEVADFFNRDGLLDYPASQVRFLPDEVLFTPGTRSGLAMVLEVLGADGSGVVVPRPSWEYDWYVERAGKKLVELPTSAPEFLPDPKDLDRLLAKGGISSVILNNPHNPTGRVYPRALVEELVRVAVKHRCYVLYDSVYQRLDYVGWFVNPAFADPEWRDWVVSLSGLSKMDMFGASTGTRACWMVISDQIRSNGVRAREILANLSAWLVATPSTLAQDWALAALQSPLAVLRRPSPYMRERRDFMVAGGRRARPARRRADRLRRHVLRPARFPGPRRRAVRPAPRRHPREGRREGLGRRLRAPPLGRRRRNPVHRVRRLGRGPLRDVAAALVRLEGREGAVGLHRPRPRAHHEAGAPRVERPRRGRRAARAATLDAVWESVCTADGYDALDGLDPKAFATARKKFLKNPRHETLRLTGTKHPDSTTHRAEQLERALHAAPAGRARPREARAEAPRVEPPRRGAAGVRGDDRRPPRAVQRGPPRLRGTPDQPRVARPAREGRPRAPAPRDRPGRGPPPPLPRPEPLHRAGRGEDRPDPRLGRTRERPVPPRLRESSGSHPSRTLSPRSPSPR